MTERPTSCGDCGAAPTTREHRCTPTVSTPLGLPALVDELEARVTKPAGWSVDTIVTHAGSIEVWVPPYRAEPRCIVCLATFPMHASRGHKFQPDHWPHDAAPMPDAEPVPPADRDGSEQRVLPPVYRGKAEPIGTQECEAHEPTDRVADALREAWKQRHANGAASPMVVLPPDRLHLQEEWAATDTTSVDLDMWPEQQRIRSSREEAEDDFIRDGDDVLLRRMVTPWSVVATDPEAEGAIMIADEIGFKLYPWQKRLIRSLFRRPPDPERSEQ